MLDNNCLTCYTKRVRLIKTLTIKKGDNEMATQEKQKKPKYQEIEFEVSFLGFRLKFKRLLKY